MRICGQMPGRRGAQERRPAPARKDNSDGKYGESVNKDCVDFDNFIENMAKDKEVLKTYREIYDKCNKIHTLPYPGINSMLEKLDKSDSEVAICSNRIQNLLDDLTGKFFSTINFKYVS